MKNYKKSIFNLIILTLFGCMFGLFSTSAFSQQQMDIDLMDLSDVRVDELSDNQVKQFVRRAESEGMTMRELEVEAISRGMPLDEVNKLKRRIEKLRMEEFDIDSLRDEREIIEKETMYDTILWQRLKEKELEPKIFGYDLFRRQQLTFEPSLNIPTPRDYQIGAGDELIIDVWGATQQTYSERVTNEGQIKISNLAPIQVSGLTIEQASDIIISRLSNIYSGIRGSKPNVFAQVSLGDTRGIKVTLSGDVYMPGTYTLPAFATAFNALYLSGGPSEKGSFRKVYVIRQGEIVSQLDIYDFLVKGETSSNIRLKDEDLIFVKPYKNHIMLEGEVKRPFIYELKENETLADLINYSGGFTADAYQKKLLVTRKTDTERKLLNVSSDLYSSFIMKDGDSINVEKILERYKNRVTISGSVFREGEYALQEGMKLTDLVKKAEGPTEDAFLKRIAIYRLQEDLQVEVIDVNLKAILDGNTPDIILQREDMVMISSLFELEEERNVKIMGEVQSPGEFPYARNISLGELVRKAEGFTDAASLARVEVARRTRDRNAVRQQSITTEVFSFPINEQLSLEDEVSSFILEPFDIVFVRRSPGYQTQKIAKIEGEVHFPGSYAIADKSERISDLVRRAGGITEDAYLEGATLIRQVEVEHEEIIEHLEDAILYRGDTVEGEDTINNSIQQTEEQRIGIDLERILSQPHSINDLRLMEGDVLEIPMQLETVRLRGALLYPITVRYQSGMSVRRYVSRAGGFADNANRRKVYVIYPNGTVDRTRNFVLFRSYPSVEPGSEIIVPEKPEREGRSIQELLAISSSASSLALVLISIMNQLD